MAWKNTLRSLRWLACQLQDFPVMQLTLGMRCAHEELAGIIREASQNTRQKHLIWLWTIVGKSWDLRNGIQDPGMIKRSCYTTCSFEISKEVTSLTIISSSYSKDVMARQLPVSIVVHGLQLIMGTTHGRPQFHLFRHLTFKTRFIGRSGLSPCARMSNAHLAFLRDDGTSSRLAFVCTHPLWLEWSGLLVVLCTTCC